AGCRMGRGTVRTGCRAPRPPVPAGWRPRAWRRSRWPRSPPAARPGSASPAPPASGCLRCGNRRPRPPAACRRRAAAGPATRGSRSRPVRPGRAGPRWRSKWGWGPCTALCRMRRPRNAMTRATRPSSGRAARVAPRDWHLQQVGVSVVDADAGAFAEAGDVVLGDRDGAAVVHADVHGVAVAAVLLDRVAGGGAGDRARRGGQVLVALAAAGMRGDLMAGDRADDAADHRAGLAGTAADGDLRHRAAVGAGRRAVGRAVAVAVIAAPVTGAGAARAHAHREGEGGRAEDVADSNGHVVGSFASRMAWSLEQSWHRHALPILCAGA